MILADGRGFHLEKQKQSIGFEFSHDFLLSMTQALRLVEFLSQKTNAEASSFHVVCWKASSTLVINSSLCVRPPAYISKIVRVVDHTDRYGKQNIRLVVYKGDRGIFQGDFSFVF